MKFRHLAPTVLLWLAFGCVVFYNSPLILRAIYCWPMVVLIFVSDTERIDKWREDTND